MVRYLVVTAVLLVVLAFCFPVYAQQQQKAARFRYALWSSEMNAKLQVTSGSSFGTEFSLNDLAMDKKERIDVWEVEMWEGSLRMDLSYWENRWDGYAQIRTTDVSVTSFLSQNYQAAFGITGGVKYIEYYVKLWDQTPGSEVVAVERAVAPIPYLGVMTEFMMGETTVLGARFVMFNYAYGGTHVDVSNFYQVDAYVEFRAGTAKQGGGLALRIGFHNIVIDYENRTPGDGFKIRQIMKGTYAAIYLSF